MKKDEKTEYFNQIDQALQTMPKPSEYLNTFFKKPICNEMPFQMLKELKHTPQSPKHHPEGNVWIHTLMVVDEAAKQKQYSKNPKYLMWAALLHDIGKPGATKIRQGKITAYNHDKIGAALTKTFLEALTTDKEMIHTVSALVRWHMQIMFVVKKKPMANIKEMKKQTDIEEIALLGFCDRMGRLYAKPQEIKKTIQTFLNIVETS